MRLSEAELTALLSGEEAVTLSIDTNVSRSSKHLIRLLDLAAQVEAAGVDVALAVSAPAFAEILMDLRQRFGERYDPSQIDDFLIGNAMLRVEAFDQADADHMAARLAARFGGDGAWQAAKVAAAFAELRLTDRADDLRKPSARCSATVDWLIGSQAARRGWVLVTDDKGPEFADLPRVVGHGTLRAALTAMGAPG